MVAAYLRGLLKPKLKYGMRSLLAEELILEALSYDLMADTMRLGVEADFSLVSSLEPESRQEHVNDAYKRLARVAQVREFDVFRVAQQLARDPSIKNTKQAVSTFQLYKIAEEQGVFDAMSADDAIAEANATPLL